MRAALQPARRAAVPAVLALLAAVAPSAQPAAPDTVRVAYRAAWPDALGAPDTTTQTDGPGVRRPNALRLVGVSGLALATGGAAMATQYNRWWKDNGGRFRFREDWRYVLWTDKLGHAYTGQIHALFYGNAFEWAGLETGTARAVGAGVAWANMLIYEVMDGFGPQWGFSTGDLLFNTLGVGYQYARWYVPAVEATRFKMSYWPSGWDDRLLVDDYMGQVYWLTLGARAVTPDAWHGVVPPWLNLAVGYGARDLGAYDFLQTPYVYLGLDFAPSQLGLDHPVWNIVAGIFDYVHLPAPAIRLTPRPALVLLAY